MLALLCISPKKSFPCTYLLSLNLLMVAIKVILLIIDALRYDFAFSKSTDKETTISAPHYHDKLVTVKNLLTEKRRNSLLFKFIADPPTTTLQRLKGLTTGTLPTFIDAGSNFAGYAIEEDNIIDQLIKRGKNVTFMGDDTWSSLFPGRFLRKYPFPSFDVKDLHTVDDGILSVLYQELVKKDWSLLVAHFLGVDHCGHKYGPNHLEMAKKLTQMDQVIKNITDAMDKDTVLFVFGDHGMTQTGDHGGDSPEEVAAALFAYSPTSLHENTQNIREAVSQVDLVPTLSLLLDVPIPFSSLGRVIPEFFPEDNLLRQATRANAWQVVRYAENYGRKSHDGSLARKFEPLLKIVANLAPEEFTPNRCLEMIGQFHGIFEESWAKFHSGWMAVGLLTLLENLFCFAVYEDQVARFLGQTSLLIVLIGRMKPSEGNKRKRMKFGTVWKFLEAHFGVKVVLLFLAALFLLRFGWLFNRCREEQIDCQTSKFTVPFASLPNRDNSYTYYILRHLDDLKLEVGGTGRPQLKLLMSGLVKRHVVTRV